MSHASALAQGNTWWERHHSDDFSSQGLAKVVIYSGSTYWSSPENPFLVISSSFEDRTICIVWQSQSSKFEDLKSKVSQLLQKSANSSEFAESIFNCRSFLQFERLFAVDHFKPTLLEPVIIAKPWGEEVWHSGTEKRGVSYAICQSLDHSEASTVKVPLPFFELAMGYEKAKKQSGLLLLKELAPHDEPFYGELYTEIHTKKSEIYVVTELGRNSCPDKVGMLKIGLSPSCNSKEKLEQTLSAYEKIRAKIDGQLSEAGFNFHGTNTLTELKKQKLLLAKSDLQTEAENYKAVCGLFAYQALRVGDCVKVPPFLPHALQPGVRVIEFQTPHYERIILSSNQKVLTQDSWNVKEGVELLEEAGLDASSTSEELGTSANLLQPDVKKAIPGTSVDIVSEANLNVKKLTMNIENKEVHFSKTSASLICFVVEGEICYLANAEGKNELKPTRMKRGLAYVLPRSDASLSLVSDSGQQRLNEATLVVGSEKNWKIDQGC